MDWLINTAQEFIEFTLTQLSAKKDTSIKHGDQIFIHGFYLEFNRISERIQKRIFAMLIDNSNIIYQEV